MTQSGYRKPSIDQRALHVDAATAAAVLALQKAQRGINNIAEPRAGLLVRTDEVVE
jgi:hypothetical protein